MNSRRFVPVLALMLICATVNAQTKPTKPRARDLGIPFDGATGPLNAITDVAGVEVGLVTLISGNGKLVTGKGPVRTGVTAVLPRGKNSTDQVFGAWFTLNGNGEMTGTTWIEESGYVEGPIMITNTHSVGIVRDGVIDWQMRKHGKTMQPWSLPIVAETYDGFLNDINGFHVGADHAAQALDQAASGPVAEGNTGGGTGMVAHGFRPALALLHDVSQSKARITPLVFWCKQTMERASDSRSRAFPSVVR